MAKLHSDLFTTIWRLENQGKFKLIANADVSFPVMNFIQPDEKNLLINIFNLVGVDSPLPHYLLELAINNQAFAEFLIIFNEQLYHLFYAIWKATHPLANQYNYQRLVQPYVKGYDIDHNYLNHVQSKWMYFSS